jgi:hypothetical protein
MEKCKQETSATKMAEYYGIITPDQAGWNTQTCVLGWGVVGIWPPGADGSDVNSADRSACGRYVATGDDFGQLKIFNYPCAKVCLFVCSILFCFHVFYCRLVLRVCVCVL